MRRAELSTGTSTTFAEWHLSCRLMAVQSPFHLQCRSLTDQPFWTLVTEPAFRVLFQTCLSLESEGSCSTRQRVGWREYVVRKVRTWLCPGLPRLCSTRAVCTEIMNQSGIPASCGQLKGRGAMPDEESRPQFVFFVAAGAALLDVTVTCFTCEETLEAQRRRPFHLVRGIPCANFLPGTDAHRVPVTANRLTPVTHHGFCELELLCDRDRRVADAVALSLSLGVLITEARRPGRSGRVLACLAGTSSIQVIARQQLGVVTFIVFSLSAAQRQKVSGTASSAEKHNVLDPNGTSEYVAGRRG